MILGNITIYQCDSVACDNVAIVPIEHEAEYEAKWHLGMAHHFCPEHKGKIANAAAVLEDEQTRDGFRNVVVYKFDPATVIDVDLEEVPHAA